MKDEYGSFVKEPRRQNRGKDSWALLILAVVVGLAWLLVIKALH